MEKALQGKVAIVTGASRGLGFEIAKKYLDAGARVALCARDGAALERASAALTPFASSGEAPLALAADVSAERDVNAVVEAAAGRYGRIDILVNNAGIYGPKGAIDEVDWREWTRAMEINLYGSVLMCRAVLPHLRARGRGKIVQLSGGGATNPLPRLSAYAVSKAAIIRFVETLAEELRGQHIDVNAIAPGALNTRMLDEVLAAGPDKVGAEFYARAQKQEREGGAPLGRGAELALFLASASSDGITGKLISAIWDPWQSLPEHLDDLTSSDIYTLRRIVPGDRGKPWGNK
jgi:NAD(P)-dependent dehydrogenase (short-subunit alcohol dehydrogenase family)